MQGELKVIDRQTDPAKDALPTGECSGRKAGGDGDVARSPRRGIAEVLTQADLTHSHIDTR